MVCFPPFPPHATKSHPSCYIIIYTYRPRVLPLRPDIENTNKITTKDMKKLSTILCTLALFFIGVGGVNSVYATKTPWDPSNAFGTEWNATTNTLSWTYNNNGWYILYTGFTPKSYGNTDEVDISEYTKIRVTISNLSGCAIDDKGRQYLELKVNSTDKSEQTIKLYEGINNIVFAYYSSTIDFEKVTEVSVCGTLASSAEEASGSAVITECYLYNPVKTITVATGFGDEITSLDGITDGTKFVIGDGTNAMYFISPDDNARNSRSAAVANVPNDSYYYYTLTKVDGLDLNGDSKLDDNLYIVNIVNGAGTAFPNQWGWPNKLNISQHGGIFSARATSTDNPVYGLDYNYGALWKVAYVDDEEHKGFTFQNASTEKPNYLKVAGEQADVFYLHLYESITFDTSTDLEKEEDAANDELFALANASGYNTETGILTNGGWTFDTPVDISHWDYLMITTVNNPSDASHEITITDNNGVSVHGEDYVGATAGTGGKMWLDRWNNQNAIRISIDYLRINKGMDITKIKSLSIGGTTKIANVYLTDYNNTYINGGYANGESNENNVKREYTATTVGKFGTICLPYVASYAGAEVYSIAGKSDNSISLEKVSGLLEAGKPYFYVAADANGKNNGADNTDVHNVNFFRADLAKFDAAEPIANNGLIGTFDGTTAPQGENYLVLSNNQLWEVNSGVTIGANKAYIDWSQITNASSRGTITLNFNDATGINAVAAPTSDNAFYNLSGQRVSQPRKGLYILNGKKIFVK